MPEIILNFQGLDSLYKIRPVEIEKIKDIQFSLLGISILQQAAVGFPGIP
jgi:hypothetical protein